ncbi:hypothetical protein NEUTE2DRAFT_129653 [Neurospora tetrasperma FGSC 2509]|nr:hypothetical protein NEUTE2DRAFT_129653 [Neurospora tetrasperma FGSC 2509]
MARCKQQAQNGHQHSLSPLSAPCRPTQAPERAQASSAAPTTTTTTGTSSTLAASAVATYSAIIAAAQLNERGCEALLEYVNTNHPLGPLRLD